VNGVPKSDHYQNRRWNFQQANIQNFKFVRKIFWGKNCTTFLQDSLSLITLRDLLNEVLKSHNTIIEIFKEKIPSV
jgi:hypothetical protein